jgi:hypothetical protein
MPSWLRDYLRVIAGPVGFLLQWSVGVSVDWIRWVNSTLRGMVLFSMRSYVLLTYDVANFSFYVGGFAEAARKWVEWLRYDIIPLYFAAAEKYTRQQVKIEHDYQDRERAKLRAFLLAVIGAVAKLLDREIKDETAARKRAVQQLRDFLLGFIAYVARQLTGRINAEIAARKQADAALRAWALNQFKLLWAYARSILPTVDKEAAAGYNATRQGQATGISRLIDDLAVDNPLVRDVVGKLATLVIDLASVEDPVARLAAQLLLTQVIDRLGVDKLAGGLVAQLGGLFTGGGPPKTLADVEKAVGDRLNATEGQWQQFYANGGDDLETLGSQMRKSAAPLFTVGMAAYFAAAVTDPAGTAAATDDVVTPACRAVLGPLLALLGG